MPRERYVVRPTRQTRAPHTQLTLFRRTRQRVFYPFHLWEETTHGLWRVVHGGDEHRQLLREAIAFTGNATLYGEAMRRVIREWPVSCAHNLSCVGMNRHAWVGHAACCLARGVPEAITREAWHYLTQAQQDAANAVASHAIAEWEQLYDARHY